MNSFKYIFPKKFTSNHLEDFIHDFYIFFTKHKGDGNYVFDLSDVEWMSNEEMLVLTAIFKNLFEINAKFKVNFLKNGSTEFIDRRVASQITQIWNVWKIYQITADDKFENIFDIHGSIVQDLIKRFGLNVNSNLIYERYGITPFITLESIKEYDDRIISNMLKETYSLSNATNEILQSYNCNMPFENHTLSSIITKELYENFLDHVTESFFSTYANCAFLSLSLVPKLKESEENNYQRLLGKNFKEESIPEVKGFYYDNKQKKFKNQSLLQFSFLDFGPGIVSTLRNEYLKKNPSANNNYENLDSEILKFAFNFDSSKDPLEKRYLEKTVIPRGLFDLLSIVKRFNGLLIARSNFGKIFFDFSKQTLGFEKPTNFGSEKKFFPGTLITIIFPERETNHAFDTSKILTPQLRPLKLNERLKPNFISLLDLLKSVDDGLLDKSKLYSKLFDKIVSEISINNNNTIHYFDFRAFEIDERITKKIIHFLASDYNVNSLNNVIVLNPPSSEFLENLNIEILQLSFNVQSYRLHPVPFIKKLDDKLEIFWLGIYNKNDLEKLNDLLLEENDLRRSDFEDPQAISGNVNFFDNHGNLRSYINTEEVVNYLERMSINATSEQVRNIISKYIVKKDDHVFLCPGNYYQREYLQLYDAINNTNECKILASALLEEIKRNCIIDSNTKFICVTASSRQIVKHFDYEDGLIPEVIYIDNYHSIIYDSILSSSINTIDRIILICDLFSTGFLTNIIYSKLKEIGANLEKIAVLVDAADENFEPENVNFEVREKVVSITKLQMLKFRRKDLSEKLASNLIRVIRINPYTNTPIMESYNDNPSFQRILMSNEDFMNIIKDEHIKAGYFKFNNLIHPYFFDMGNVFKDSVTTKLLLSKLFENLNEEIKKNVDIIFYPKGSSVQLLDFEILKSEIFKRHAITVTELERFSTNEGWRFPHPPKHIKSLSAGKNVLIIDDGSCSGDSLTQMIDEVAALDVTEIYVLSIIGRLNDHKKDFFSRLNTINGKSGTIPIYVFFGVQWHIPTYYIEESPILKEKQWLDFVLQIPNLPGRIQTIARNILEELSLKDVNSNGNKYLLKRKDKISITKDLILIKEEIGKVTSYRYYLEYFEYFDRFIQQYEGKIAEDHRTKMIESICAVFLHEPDLHSKIKTILPDVTEKIEIFIRTILFGNPEREDKKKLLVEQLFYTWSNKNIIHLFFIFFNEDSLFEILTPNNLKIFLNDFVKHESDLYYIFYRLLKYLPIHSKDSKKQFAGNVKYLIEVLKESSDIDPHTKRHLKRFSIFISSLPSQGNDFLDTLANIKMAYGRVMDDVNHNDYIYNDKQVVVSQLRLLTKYKNEGVPFVKVLDIINRHWNNIAEFISNVLSFYRSHSEFFLVHNYTSINSGGKKSLAELFGIVDDAINSENFSNIDSIILYINDIFQDFILEGSVTNKLFTNITVQNFSNEFNQFIENIKDKFPDVSIVLGSDIPKIQINLPLLYLKEVIFKEITSNFRYANLNMPVEIKILEGDNIVQFEISNYIGQASDIGGGQGLNKLSLINSFPFASSYQSTTNNELFIQIIKLSKI